MTFAAPDRDDAAAGLGRRTAHDARLQRQDPAHRRPRRRGEAELVAEGVWVVQGQPARCNVYLIEDEGGVTLFDAGARTMTRAVAERRREARRHPRGSCSATATPTTAAPPRRWACPCCATPTRCRTPKAAAASATGPRASPGCRSPHRQVHRLMHRYAWDGGPVKIAGTRHRGRRGRGLQGDRAARPRARARSACGASPTAWRSSATASTRSTSGAATASRTCRSPIYNYDTEQARASMRKLAELEPAAAWPGHAKPRHRRRARRSCCAAADARLSVGRRSRRRSGREAAPRAPSSDYEDAEGNVLTLRGSLSAGSRREYAGARCAGAPLSREDAGQRAFELLFERLAVRWTIAGVPTEGQRELLGRLRLASPAERAVGARDAARALRGALPRRSGALQRSGRLARAAPGARPARCRRRRKRAVAGLSTNSQRLAALAAHLEAPALLEHRDDRAALEAAAEVGDARARRRRAASAGRVRARPDARRPAAAGRALDTVRRCAAPRSSPPSAPPRASPRRSCAWSRRGWTSRG